MRFRKLILQRPDNAWRNFSHFSNLLQYLILAWVTRHSLGWFKGGFIKVLNCKWWLITQACWDDKQFCSFSVREVARWPLQCHHWLRTNYHLSHHNQTKLKILHYFYDYDVTLKIHFNINYCYWFFSFIASIEFVIPRTLSIIK